MHKGLLVFFGLALMALQIMAAPSDLGGASYDTSAPIDISASNFQTLSNGWVAASGNVVIRQNDAQLTADRILVNKDSHIAKAEGNVILIRKGQAALRSKSLSYNFKTGEATSPGLDVQAQSLRVISKTTTRDLHGAYHLSDTIVTTCTNDPSSLHYCVTAKNGEFVPNQYVLLHGAKVRFLGLPVFYYPLFQRSLVDHFGWTFIPGYESDWGAYLLTSYRTQLVNFGGEWNDSINSKSHFDFRTDRGWAFGEDLSWSFGDQYDGGSRGYISLYGVLDDDPMGEKLDRYDGRDVAEDTRYRITLRHDTYFTPQNYLTIRTSYLSDSYVFQDFYEDEFKDYVQPESYISFTHNGDYISYGIGVNHRVNEFYSNVNRLPDLWLDSSLTEIGDSGIYYESQSSGGLLQYEFADYGTTNIPPESYDSFRVDSRHVFSSPLKLFGFLSVVPRAQYRGTFYSKTRDAVSEEFYNPTTTNYETRTSYKEGSGGLRNLFELGAELSMKAYGFYKGENGTTYRHVVEPYANWTFVPEPNLRPDDLYQFDSVDRLDKGHYIRTGLRQLLQNKSEGSINQIFDLDLYTIYFFEDEKDEKGFRKYGADLEWAVSPSIKLNTNTEYNPDLNEFDYVDFWLTMWQGQRWEASGSCYFIPDDTTLFKGNIRCNFSENWAMGGFVRYDSEGSRCELLAGYLQYNLDCISFRFRSEYEPAYERDDGTEREAKLKFSFNAWLRAYTPPRYERRLRDGYWDD